MDILIKDLAIPEDGAYDYNITIRSDGKVEGWQQVGQWIVRIHSWAVEVPPHGRCIDANDLIRTLECAPFYDGCDYDLAMETVCDAPTVLEESYER